MKRLKLSTAGAFLVLALMMFPASSLAAEFTKDCASGASCSGTVSGGVTAITNTEGEKIECSSSEGSATHTSSSSTGTLQLSFKGCKEKLSGLNFSCNSFEAPSGIVRTNPMTYHLIYIDPSATTPGILITGANWTLTCASFTKKTVTGDLIGHWTNPQCSSFASSHTATFEQVSAGQQKFKQVTTVGTAFDLTSNNDVPESTYKTTAMTGAFTFTAALGNNEKFTC